MFNLEIKTLATDTKIDIDAIDLRLHECKYIHLFGGLEKAIDKFRKAGPGYVMYINGKFIAAGGLVIMWPGVAELWQLPSNLVPKYRFVYSRTCRRIVHELFLKYNLSRLQVHAPDDTLHNRWAEFLGMSKEGVMQQYGPIDFQNWAMFSMVKGGVYGHH